MLMPFLSYLHNLLSDACIIFQKRVDDFEIEHKTCLFLVKGAVSLNVWWFLLIMLSILFAQAIQEDCDARCILSYT